MKGPLQLARETCFALSTDIGLDRNQRLQVATYLLDREIQSFKHLSLAELLRVVDGLRGAWYVQDLQNPFT